jgi:hypothetical protein
MTELVQRVHRSGECWGDVNFLTLLAETQHAQGDTEAARATAAAASASLGTGPLHAPELARLQLRLAESKASLPQGGASVQLGVR